MEDILKYIYTCIQSIDYLDAFETVFKLALAAIFGGIIGKEREHINRPAGLRTHMLVCVGSALVLMTSIAVLNDYKGIVNVDPTRMGAQVVSGIGFLGAGTIIKEGFSVKGLTTAASLWAVSCIGLAIGAGFYGGAVTAAILIYIALELIKRLLLRKVVNKSVTLEVSKIDNVVETATDELTKLKLKIISTDIGVLPTEEDREPNLTVTVVITMPKQKELFDYAVDRLRKIEGVVNCSVE